MRQTDCLNRMRIFVWFVCLAVPLITGCSRRTSPKTLVDWLWGKEENITTVELDREIFAIVNRNNAGDVTHVFITVGADVVSGCEIYGNGFAVHVPDNNKPAVLVHSGASGYGVSRTIIGKEGTKKLIIYGDDGSIIEEQHLNQK